MRNQPGSRGGSEITTVWSSYTSWSEANRLKFLNLSNKTVGVSGFQLGTTRQTEAFSDEPTEDLNIQLLHGGNCHLKRHDSGFGKSTDLKVGLGSWILVPPKAHLDLEGEGDFSLVTGAVPWKRNSRDIEMMSKQGVVDFGPLHQGVQTDPLISSLLTKIVVGGPQTELVVEAGMAIILRRFLQMSDQLRSDTGQSHSGLSRAQLSAAIDYIHAHATGKVSLQMIANEAGISRFHFLRSFKATTGVTPNEYLLQLRTELGRGLLRQGKTIFDAALDAGFSDQSHFTHQFKRRFGLPPGRYLKEVKRR